MSFNLQNGAVDLTRTIGNSEKSPSLLQRSNHQSQNPHHQHHLQSTASAEKAAAAKKLAFSVENILDPTKFCSRQDVFSNNNNTIKNQHHGNERLWTNGGGSAGYEGEDRMMMDDDRSDSQSGKRSFAFGYWRMWN